MSTTDKTYRYSGPMSGATLREGKKAREVMFIPGKTVSLPPDNPQVKAMVARGHLEEVKAARPAAKKPVKQEEK